MNLDEMMASMGLPVGFGKKTKQQSKSNLEKSTVEVSVPVAEEEKQVLDNNPTDQDSDDDFGPQPLVNMDQEELDELPLCNSQFLKAHSKSVTAIAIDPSGGRLITGGRDHQMIIWDFHTMDKRLHHYKRFEPIEGNPIVDLAFGSTGDRFLLASPESVIKVFSREGELKATFAKGDPYIRDPKRTVGHTSQITSVNWAPNDKKAFYTASYDSTIRLWNIEDPKKHVWVIPVKSKVPGCRTPITSVSMSQDSRMVVGGAEDGVLRVWSTKGPFVLPTHSLENAHKPGMAISSVLFKRDGRHLYSRGMDDTLKLFDIRAFKKPLAIVPDLTNLYESTNILLTPDEKYVLTGTSIGKNEGSGSIKIFDSTSLKIVREVDMGSASVVKLHWHTRINQIFAGLSDGNVSVLYNPSSSCAGILEPLSREVKKKAIDDIEYNTGYIEVEAEEEKPIFPEEYEYEQQDERLIDELRNYVDPRDLRKPELPGRRVRPNTAYLKNGEVAKAINEDPREAILKHAEEAATNPYWIAPAYKKTQPVPVYSSSVYANEEEAKRDAKKRRRQ